MLKTVLYARSDCILVLRRDVYAQPHRHHALQLTLALAEPLLATLDAQQVQAQALLIDHNQRHLVHGQPGWVATLLINPQSLLAQQLRADVLCQRPWAVLPQLSTASIRAAALHLASLETSAAAADSWIEQLLAVMLPAFVPAVPLDPRIEAALRLIERAPDYKIAARTLAARVHISEGRFGHLFSAEVGVPLRRYLLWRRLLSALQQIAAAADFTTAAHAAGFSDSAHLSHTFRRMFGLRLSALFAARERLYVIPPPPADA